MPCHLYVGGFSRKENQICQQQCNRINKAKDEHQAPHGAPQAIAKQLLVTDDEVSHHDDEEDCEDGHLIEKEPARQHQQEEGHLQAGKKDLDKEPLGQRVAGVAWRVTEHDPGGDDEKEGHHHHGPTEICLIPVIKRLGHFSHVYSLIGSKAKFTEIQTVS